MVMPHLPTSRLTPATPGTLPPHLDISHPQDFDDNTIMGDRRQEIVFIGVNMDEVRWVALCGAGALLHGGQWLAGGGRCPRVSTAPARLVLCDPVLHCGQKIGGTITGPRHSGGPREPQARAERARSKKRGVLCCASRTQGHVQMSRANEQRREPFLARDLATDMAIPRPNRQAKICAQLDGALLSDDEMKTYTERWASQPDPPHPEVSIDAVA